MKTSIVAIAAVAAAALLSAGVCSPAVAYYRPQFASRRALAHRASMLVRCSIIIVPCSTIRLRAGGTVLGRRPSNLPVQAGCARTTDRPDAGKETSSSDAFCRARPSRRTRTSRRPLRPVAAFLRWLGLWRCRKCRSDRRSLGQRNHRLGLARRFGLFHRRRQLLLHGPDGSVFDADPAACGG